MGHSPLSTPASPRPFLGLVASPLLLAITWVAADGPAPSLPCVDSSTQWAQPTMEDSKLKMYEGKSFPLYAAMGVLYEGHIAQGRHCLTSRKPPTITKSGSNFGAKEKMVASSSKRNTRDRSDDSMRTPSIIDINDIPAWDDVDGDAERENTARDEEEFGSEDADGDHPQISESSAKGRRPKKQKSATYVQRLEDSMMAYLLYREDDIVGTLHE
ncbi:hypothetical protein ZWY2020_057137 [Hordeum vulgare]|nr:hypothetical protein ZWY2020_057137 [Hordeum vulgare]